MRKMPASIIAVRGEYAEVDLLHGLCAIIDIDDIHLVEGERWIVLDHGRRRYAITRRPLKPGLWRNVYMHRLILAAPPGLVVDHRDGDGLNNRRSNIRLATSSQNNSNRAPNKTSSSTYKGVSLHPSGLWRARIKVGRKEIHLGYFRTEKDAHAAYCASALELHGEFARTE